MGYDVRAIRAHFPALAAGAAHFDGPGGSQVPDTVAAAVADTLLSPLANRGSVTAAERAADAVVLAARAAMGDLLGVDPRGVVFGRSMTALTFDLARTLAATWGPDDEVIVTRLDHDANIRPWIRAAEAVGAAVRLADFDPRTAELTVADVARELSSRTRVVAVTGASNLLGTRPPVPLIAAAAHERGALVVVDGVHLTAHAPVDVAALGADFYACSPVQVPRPALRGARRRPGPAGLAHAREARALARLRARALRAGHAALRAARRHHRRRRLPRRARPRCARCLGDGQPPANG